MPDFPVAVPVGTEAILEDPLLRSRFEIPDRPPFAVARSRLLDRLHRSDAPVALIVGSPGSGKTQLVASWVADLTMPTAVAWINLEDEPDHQELCNREQRYFLNAIRNNVDLTDHVQDAVNSLRIAFACDESVRSGNTVTL